MQQSEQRGNPCQKYNDPERHYVGLVNIQKEAATLEQAMGIVPLTVDEPAEPTTKKGRPRQGSNLQHPA